MAAVGASDHSLPWSAASLAYSQPSSYRSGELYPVRLVSRDTPRANSSWTSHFTQIVRDLTAEQDEAQVKQLASLNLSAPNQYVAAAAPAAGTQMAASNNRSGRSLTDREFRDLDARFGVKGSSVSIKF